MIPIGQDSGPIKSLSVDGREEDKRPQEGSTDIECAVEQGTEGYKEGTQSRYSEVEEGTEAETERFK